MPTRMARAAEGGGRLGVVRCECTRWGGRPVRPSLFRFVSQVPPNLAIVIAFPLMEGVYNER